MRLFSQEKEFSTDCATVVPRVKFPYSQRGIRLATTYVSIYRGCPLFHFFNFHFLTRCLKLSYVMLILDTYLTYLTHVIIRAFFRSSRDTAIDKQVSKQLSGTLETGN